MKRTEETPVRRELRGTSKESPAAEWTPLCVILVLLMTAGLLQSPLASVVPNFALREYIDDAFLALAALAVLFRLSRSSGIIFLACLFWLIGVVLGLIQQTASLSDSIVFARQISVPVVLIFIGAQLRFGEWLALKTSAIFLGLLNVTYMIVEITGVHLFDPAAIETFSASGDWLIDGLPRYYYYWSGIPGMDPISRLGGLALNPPIAGLMASITFVLIWHTKGLRFRRTLLAITLVVAILTFARGGWLVIAAGVVLPILAEKIGKIGATILLAPVAYFAGNELVEQGQSASHSDGLVQSLRDAFTSPFGHGFGEFGNYASNLTNDVRGSETLAGIAFNGFGLMAILLFAACFVVLWFRVGREGEWESAFGIGILAAALLSESAGALNGTAFAWLAVGIALPGSKHSKQDGNKTTIMRLNRVGAKIFY